jgi:hypothetical protein
MNIIDRMDARVYILDVCGCCFLGNKEEHEEVQCYVQFRGQNARVESVQGND